MTILHILSNPNGTVNFNNRIDPFSIATWKFIHHMSKRGWNCIHYGTPGSEVDCESVLCLDSFDQDHGINTKIYNKKAGEEIGKRKTYGDLILCFYGWDNRDAALEHTDLRVVEPSIGYSVRAVFAGFRVFASYAHMHNFYGCNDITMPSFFDAVIPNAITPEEFEYNENKQDYILYFGRVIESKGVYIAIDAAKQAGMKIIVAGPGNLGRTNSHVEVVGTCDINQRRQLMRDAAAIIGPTQYIEPFGNMIVEGYMSGTPAITTDWGAFTETVVQGVTGYRCREMSEFVYAIKNLDKISPQVCRNWAVQNYSDDVVHDRYDFYLRKVLNGNFYREIL